MQQPQRLWNLQTSKGRFRSSPLVGLAEFQANYSYISKVKRDTADIWVAFIIPTFQENGRRSYAGAEWETLKGHPCNALKSVLPVWQLASHCGEAQVCPLHATSGSISFPGVCPLCLCGWGSMLIHYSAFTLTGALLLDAWEMRGHQIQLGLVLLRGNQIISVKKLDVTHPDVTLEVTLEN